MSSTVHSVIMLPGSKIKLFCMDGLNPLDVQHIENIYNFGGAIKAVNCGVQNEWLALEQANASMKSKYDSSHGREKSDFYLALKTNWDSMKRFHHTSIYKEFIRHKDWPEVQNDLFHKWMLHMCGHSSGKVFNGFMGLSPRKFKERVCPR